jgi:integrase
MKRGSNVVSLTRLSDGTYCVYWSANGKQHRIVRKLEKDARAEAARQLDLMRVGIDQPVTDWPKAVAIAEKHGMTVMQALQEWEQLRSEKMTARQSTALKSAVEMFLSAKDQQNLSRRHLADLTQKLNHLMRVCPWDLSLIDHQCLQKGLTGSDWAPKTVRQVHGAWRTFFRWCKRQGMLPADWDHIDRLDLPRIPPTAPSIHTPEELDELLSVKSPRLRAYIAIAAWTGLRSAEIVRLEWKDIRDGWITVTAEKAKTGSRRIVPVLGPMMEYLDESMERPGGLTDPHQAVGSAGIRHLWKPNALRHSWISYRLALVESADKVALEAGNSPQIIFRNYRELVTPDDARRWFRNTGST